MLGEVGACLVAAKRAEVDEEDGRAFAGFSGDRRGCCAECLILGCEAGGLQRLDGGFRFGAGADCFGDFAQCGTGFDRGNQLREQVFGPGLENLSEGQHDGRVGAFSEFRACGCDFARALFMYGDIVRYLRFKWGFADVGIDVGADKAGAAGIELLVHACSSRFNFVLDQALLECLGDTALLLRFPVKRTSSVRIPDWSAIRWPRSRRPDRPRR